MKIFLCEVISLFLFLVFFYSSLFNDIGRYSCLPITSALYFLVFCYLIVNEKEK